MLFLWLKAFHLVAVVCWFAALFYLPRLFVYHAMSEDSISHERFKVMERKLYRGIATPSMVITLLLGGWLIGLNIDYYFDAIWFWCKMGCVACLIAYHLICGHFLKTFQQNNNTRSHVFYRWFNEVPVVFLIAIMILVVVKPF